MFDFKLPEPPLWYTKIIMQLWTNPGRENKVLFKLSVWVRHLEIDFILDNLSDLSSIRWRGDPFHTQWWPGSVCIDPPLRITKAPLRHSGPSSSSWPVEVRRLSSNVRCNCQTYLPFGDEMTLSIRSGGQDLYASIHHYELLRPPYAIQAIRPPTDQLKSGDCLKMWDVTARRIFPSVMRWPILYAVMARICIHRSTTTHY